MAQTINDGRQEPVFAIADCGIANIGTGNEQLIKLPANALLVNLFADTVTAFDAATTNTLTVSDGTTTFVSAVDVKSTGRETVTGVGKFYPSGGTLTVSMAQTGTAAANGRAIVSAEYVVLGRTQYTYGQSID